MQLTIVNVVCVLLKSVQHTYFTWTWVFTVFFCGCYGTRCIVGALEIKITKRAACCMLFTKCKFGVLSSGLKIQICAHGLDIWPVL